MWELLRPDAINAFKHPLVLKILPRYIKVSTDELPCNFLIAKKIEVGDFSWKEHSRGMKRLKEMRKDLDEGKMKLDEMENPEKSLLDLKIKLVEDMMKACELCEHKCFVNRMKGERGLCHLGKDMLISSEFIHMGEEFFITPSHTIFFYSCNMKCVFCQNYTISHMMEEGKKIGEKELARLIEEKRDVVRNVNFVGGEPTMHLLGILKTLRECKRNVPVVWNSNMYMSEKTMKILDGIVDVYLTDFKFGKTCGEKYTCVKDYWKIVTRNHLLASEQAEVVVRHLVLPNHVECCSFVILEWLAEHLKGRCIVNIMDQYRPEFKAFRYPEIARSLKVSEFHRVVEKAEQLGLDFIT